MFKWLFPNQLRRLAGELYENEELLQQARVNLETARHLVRQAESAVLMYSERVARQRDEVLVLEYQEQCAADLKRAVGKKVVKLQEVHHVQATGNKMA
jgi:hypothetical protein